MASNIRDWLEKLRRAADVRGARIVGPTGIAGVWRIIRGRDQAPTLATGSGSYAPGQVVPIGSYQGNTRQAILTGSLPGTGGSSAYPMLPAPVEVGANGPRIESADPDELADTAVAVPVELTGRRFRPGLTVAIVAWDSLTQDWVDDPRVTIDSQSLTDTEHITVVLTATASAVGGGGFPLTFTFE
jgi:hypothetical protein